MTSFAYALCCWFSLLFFSFSAASQQLNLIVLSLVLLILPYTPSTSLTELSNNSFCCVNSSFIANDNTFCLLIISCNYFKSLSCYCNTNLLFSYSCLSSSFSVSEVSPNPLPFMLLIGFIRLLLSISEFFLVYELNDNSVISSFNIFNKCCLLTNSS